MVRLSHVSYPIQSSTTMEQRTNDHREYYYEELLASVGLHHHQRQALNNNNKSNNIIMGRRDRDRDRRGASFSDSEEEECDYEKSKKHGNSKKKSSRDRKRKSRSPKRGDEDDEEKRHKQKRRRRRQSSEGSDDDGDDSSVAASSSNRSNSSVHSRDQQERKKRHKHDKKSKKERKQKSSKKDKKKKKKKRHRRDDEEEQDSLRGKKRNKKLSSRKDHSEESDDDESTRAAFQELERNYLLAEALHELLIYYPNIMATDTLPLLLIQLGGGTTLDLRQMTDQHAAQGLQKVLSCLSPFGVIQENYVWKWKAPTPGPNAYRDECILLKIVRTLLDGIGLTPEAIAKYEKEQHEKAEAAANAAVEKAAAEKEKSERKRSSSDSIRENTLEMLQQFNSKAGADNDKPSTLPGELGGLCNMILEGETISLEGLPDEKLRKALENLFETCGLEQCEMEQDSDSEEEEENTKTKDDKSPPSMGYGLPENVDVQERIRSSLMSVMDACKHAASTTISESNAPKKRAVKGPMPIPANYVPPEEESSSDEEGPALVGTAQKRAPKIPKELLKQQAEMRARQLKGAVTGQEELMSTDPNQREEWMLVPGKFDFLSSIKAGNSQRSRGFQTKSKAENPESSGRVLDPKVKAEMDDIMQAHAESRGPTLVEQHRMKKEQERQEKAAGKGNKGEWKWSRDRDLDAGRKVDKNALHQVLGGAVSDLKNKFQGGF